MDPDVVPLLMTQFVLSRTHRTQFLTPTFHQVSAFHFLQNHSWPLQPSLRKHKKHAIKFSFVALFQLLPLIYYHPGVLHRLRSPDAHLLPVPPVYGGAAAAQSLPYCSAICSERFGPNMVITLHAFVSSWRKTTSSFQSLNNGFEFRSDTDARLASSHGELFYPTTETFHL